MKQNVQNCSFILIFICSISISINGVKSLSLRLNKDNIIFSKLIDVGSDTTANTEVNLEKEKRLKDMENERKKLAQIFVRITNGIKALTTKINRQQKITKEVNITVIESLKSSQKLSARLGIGQIRTEIKLKEINSNLLIQLKMQIKSAVTILEQAVVSQQIRIQLLNLKISQLRLTSPKSDSICSKHFSCEPCTSNKECGWCSMTQTCMEGSKKGPKEGVCLFFDYGVILNSNN